MIQPLRTLHRRVVMTLAIFLPVLVVSAIRARRPDPPTLARPALASPYVLSNRQHLELSRSGASLYVVAHHDFKFPETLVYLSEQNTLDPRSQFLGVFRPDRLNTYSLPDVPEPHLVFFSPALSSVVDDATLAGAQ